MSKNKEYTLKLLKEKINGERKITYREINRLTGYSKPQLIRLSKELEKRDINTLLVHGNVGKPSHNSVPQEEKEYIRTFKDKYPDITISQFMDIYHEDVVLNPKMKEDVLKFGLKLRSKSFFRDLYVEFGWKSPIKHKKFGKTSESHFLREPSPNRGILIIIDGTPHDWFENGKKFSLHLSVDDATGEILAGWFMNTECLEGYCRILKLIVTRYGIPESFYSDRYSVFYNENKKGTLTQFGRMCEELNINMIYAGSAEAKGKVERWNFTIQNRLLNDIKRYDIKSVDQLNIWFNKFYIKYLNKKFSYKPKYEESCFVKIDLRHTDLSRIICRKFQRDILDGNVVSYENHYYKIVGTDNQNYPMFKGTKVTVLIDIFNQAIVRIEYRKKVFNTIQIQGHIRNNNNRKTEKDIINNQKEMQILLERISSNRKARASLKTSSS